MLIQLQHVIDERQLAVIHQALAQAEFVDGRLSAGRRAEQVKTNQEIEPGSEIASHLQKIIAGNLYNHVEFREAALPLHMAQPIVARYDAQMTYGNHIDDPVMGEQQRFRCDIALTLFLNAPGDYHGGELCVRTAFGDQRVKLAAGDAVLYPASSVHRVEPVQSGSRLVAVTWIQSMIRSAERRELLYELGLARRRLMQTQAHATETRRVDHAYVNLVRMWAEV